MSARDARLDKVEEITVDWDTFKKALERNYLEDNNYHDRSFVLRLYPPFEAEMQVEYHESLQGRHYNNDWNEKPLHILPELLILEGSNSSFRDIVDYPEEWQVKQALSVEEIEEEGGIENVMQHSKQMFWDELKTILPNEFNLSNCHGYGSYKVDVNWDFTDN